MAWYDRFIGRSEEVKENPAQYVISRDQGMTVDSRERIHTYRNAYEQLEVINRAVNMIVDDAADIPFDVGEPVVGINNIIKQIRRSRVDLLLNKEPNPFQDVNSFKRNLIIDLLIDGNIFVYFDGVHLYHLPAEHVTIETDEKTYVNKYTYDQAKAVCKAFDGDLAKYEQLEDAYDKGASWCSYGWSSNQLALYPTQKSTYDKLQEIKGHKNDCGRPGINCRSTIQNKKNFKYQGISTGTGWVPREN